MGVSHPASPGAARRVDYFDFGADAGAMSALPSKADISFSSGLTYRPCSLREPKHGL